MLSRDENELITRVAFGTPMGNAMRRYWIPALLAREVAEPDGAPVRVRLLGEDLLAFRDSAGRIGLVDEYCPHRRASLFFGRNEECGLRCVYHGWKFDVSGACVDMMNEPEENDFKHKVQLTAYPTCELGGVVWAYLGPVEHMPPVPKFAWTAAPETHLHVTKVIQECNWLQGLEGGIDGINVQDRAIQESMGRIVDRSKEHLGPADKAIIQARKLLRQAVKTVQAGGTPDGTGTSYYDLRAHEAVLPSSADWRREVTPEMRAEAILQTV